MSNSSFSQRSSLKPLFSGENVNPLETAYLDTSGLPQQQFPSPIQPKEFTPYTEQTRPLTDREHQILRESLLGIPAGGGESIVNLASQKYSNLAGERTFGALRTDALKQTLKEYQNALKKEQSYTLLQGMGLPSSASFKEDIKNSILGDIGAGGFLAFGKGEEVEKGLSKGLEKALGIQSSVQYNWQKWFDETLSKRYEELKEVTDPTDAKNIYSVEKEFAKNFITDYLAPRFDASKSIAEFISYMDVAAEDENILQTQTVSSALKDYAAKKAEAYLNDLKTKGVTKEFDPVFYRSPDLISGTDKADKADLYAQQKNAIQKAWENRKSDEAVKDGMTWASLAYQYGVDLDNENDFARLHYEVLGKDKGYDPVADTYTSRDLSNYIQTDLAEALQAQKALYSPDAVFVDFVSSEQKANEFVEKLNIQALPSDLKNRLRGLGYNEKTDPEETVKEALLGLLRTDPAIEIRERIKQLNEEEIKPTQEKLGFGYIQRDTDEEVKAPEGGTALFNLFKKSGYAGTEKEFYTDFFPDATDEDKNLYAAKSTTKKPGSAAEMLGFNLPNMSDPFSAMASIDSLFQDSSPQKTTLPTKSSYFNIFTNEEDEGAPSYFKMGTSKTTVSKSPSAQDFLGSFGSFFG